MARKAKYEATYESDSDSDASDCEIVESTSKGRSESSSSDVEVYAPRRTTRRAAALPKSAKDSKGKDPAEDDTINTIGTDEAGPSTRRSKRRAATKRGTADDSEEDYRPDAKKTTKFKMTATESKELEEFYGKIERVEVPEDTDIAYFEPFNDIVCYYPFYSEGGEKKQLRGEQKVNFRYVFLALKSYLESEFQLMDEKFEECQENGYTVYKSKKNDGRYIVADGTARKYHVYFDTKDLMKGEGTPYFFYPLCDQLNDHMPMINDTLEFAETKPENFKLELYDYQKRTLTWMLEIENKKKNVIYSNELLPYVKLEDVELPVNIRDGTLVTKNLVNCPVIECNGGILADKPGYGKTVTALALIQSNPCKTLNELNMTAGMKKVRFPCKGTLVICPSNLIEQWKNEAIRFLGNKTRVIVLSNILQHRKVSWYDLMFCDVIIVSIAFLFNKNYQRVLDPYIVERPLKNRIGYFELYSQKIISQGHNIYGAEYGQVNLEAVHYKRIIIDEFHELGQHKLSLREMIENMSAESIWGLTGTPKISDGSQIHETAKFLKCNLKVIPFPWDNKHYSENCGNGIFNAFVFKEKFFRSNNLDLNLPPLKDETIWVDFSPAETALYNSRQRFSDSKIDAFMMCSHYQITDYVASVAGEKPLSIEQVSEKLLKSLKQNYLAVEKEIMSSKKTMTSILEKIQPLKEIEFELDDNGLKALNSLQSSLNNTKRSIVNLEAKKNQLNREIHYFSSMLSSLENNTLEDLCCICLDQMNTTDKSVSVTQCGHVFCTECITQSISSNNNSHCPTCRSKISLSSIMNVDSKPKQVVEKATTEENKNKYKDYGSKIAKVLEKFDEVLQANPNAKIILFVQYRRLANLIESALNNFQIPLVRLHGTTAMRNRAISGFKYNNQTKVIMLSSEDSVSGLHLPEATHIFIVHPFWFGDGKDDQAIAAEKQGIARAYRMGLDHELQVYRFVTRNTIEESVAKARL